MKILLIVILITGSATIYAQKNENVKIEYKKRQKIDLGAIMIDGEIVSPGDFSISDEEAEMTKKLYRRKNFNDRIKINIDYVF